MHGGRMQNTRDASRTHAQHAIESFTTGRLERDGGGSQTGAGAPRKHDSGARRTAHNATPIVDTHCAHTADRREDLCSDSHVPMRDWESCEGLAGFTIQLVCPLSALLSLGTHTNMCRER